jgi:hypothetical protein
MKEPGLQHILKLPLLIVFARLLVAQVSVDIIFG